MKRSLYIDDLITEHRTAQETGELYNKAKTRLALGRFQLRKWLINSGELSEELSSENCVTR